MKHTHASVALVTFVLLKAAACRAAIPPVVSNYFLISSGVHTVDVHCIVERGATLECASGATLIFADSGGMLVVSGRLVASGTVFTSRMLGMRWAGMIGEPGATVALYQCQIAYAGTFDNYYGAAIRSRGAVCVLSNCVISAPTRHGCICEGGEVRLYHNAAATGAGYAGFWLRGGAPVTLQAEGNTNTSSGFPSIYVDGVFTHDVVFTNVRDTLFCNAVTVSNAVMRIAAGTRAGFGFPSSHLSFVDGALLYALGTATSQIVFVDYREVPEANRWRGLTFERATGVLSHVTAYRALGHVVHQGALVMSNTIITGRSGNAVTLSNATLRAHLCEFSGCVGDAVKVIGGSDAVLRYCVFRSNNPPYAASLKVDSSSRADARFCWWNAVDGPYPYGRYGNEAVTTNANSVFFPWLLAAPGAQTNPPVVRITSPAEEPHVTSESQVWLDGTVADDGQVVSVVVQNAASPVRVPVTPGADGVWRAQIWLYAGMNALAVYAYDEQGNVSVDSRLVECRGAGVGGGAARGLTMAPMADRRVLVGELVRARCVATSPDSCVLTYWVEGVPEGGTFDQALRELRFVPTHAGVTHAITFYACDGKNVAKTTMLVDVLANEPSVSIATKMLPKGYKFHPYYYQLVAGNAIGPVTWSFNDVKPPDGLVISRGGVISGVPLRHGTVNLIAVARDTRAGGAATNVLTVEIVDDAAMDSVTIPFQPIPVCVSGTSYTALYGLQATNGIAPYTWYDAADQLSEIGMGISSNGVLQGTPTVPGVHEWLPVVRDGSNGTAYAVMAIGVVAPEHQLQRIKGMCRGKLLINRVPGSQHKGSMVLKFQFTPPPGFTFDRTSPAVAQVGFTQITVPNAYKYVPGTQLVFKKVEGLKSTSIKIKRVPGLVTATFAVKRVNLNYDFEWYGMRNENVLVPKTVQIPVWVRIGNYEMATELMPLTYVTVANKSTKGKAAW